MPSLLLRTSPANGRSTFVPLVASVLVLGLTGVGLAIGMNSTGEKNTSQYRSRPLANTGLPTIPAGFFLPVVATASGTVDLYVTPSTATPPDRVWPATNSLGVTSVFLVKWMEGSWLDVYVPERPDGSTAWIMASQVRLARDDYVITVDATANRMVVTDGSATALTAPVATGKASTPTPIGTWFITDLLRQPKPDGPYGPFAYGLSTFSNVFYHFDGGPGQVGLHGTNDPSSVGHSDSDGCIRLLNADIEKLVPILPLGTPVVVRR